MKTGLFAVSVISLLQLAASQPHGGHKRFHKRAEVVTTYATVTTPEVIVWVYEDGVTASIETRTPQAASATPALKFDEEQSSAPDPTPTPEPTEPAPSLSPIQAYAQSSQANRVDSPPPPPTQAPPAPLSTPSPPPPPPPPPSSGLGICYSPYNSDGTCKSAPDVSNDLSKIKTAGYGLVRIYGVDCNQVSTVLAAAQAHNLQIFAGLLTIENVAGDLGSLIAQAQGDFSRIGTISIGNELVDMGRASVGAVVAALDVARGVLKGAGYTGAIVTVDTFNALIQHPELCRKSDYCAANAHSYFDPTMEPGGAGDWVRRQVGRIQEAVGGGKEVVITESGWPHAGKSNGVAVPSLENQRTAVQSIKEKFGGGMFLFCAFDDKWKADGAWGVEKNWGIM